ncbi:MAG: contractile injection system tape measure protein, partial [Nitrospirota bacterium]|nr:contractile injection system tape measure protein [Nitrospirota bacterium]
QALFVYGREAEVRQKLAETFPDFMLLDLVRLLTPEAAKIISKLVKQPQLLRGKSVRSFESEKKDKTVFWRYTLGVLLVERGSRFNKKSYLSRLILQMASHRNARAQDILHGLTEGFEAIEISRTAKSEILLMLRELSQEGRVQKNSLENKVTEAEAEEAFDVEMACRDVRDFLIRGRWPKNDWGARAEALFLKRLNRLFQSHRAQLSRIFGELQSANLLSEAQVVDCSPDIFARLIVIFLSLEHSEAPEFMQAMISHAAQAEHPSLYYQKVLFCLIRKNVVDFEAIVSEAIVSENRTAVSQSLEGERDERDVVVSRETDFAFAEKILVATTILSAQVLAQFLRTLETLVVAAPQDLSAFLKKGLEGRGFALRLVQLLPEPLLARLLLLLNPMAFEAILRCSDLIVSAACAKEIALSPGRMTRLKWQFIFQYLFEEGRRFHVKTFVFLLSERLARDAYYSDLVAFRVLLCRELESHHMTVMKDEVLVLVEILSQSDRVNSPHPPISKKNVSQKPSPEISSEAPSYFKEIEAEWDETIHLENAGLVIAAPYLERFLTLLDLTEGQAFKSPEAARRAVHLLQFLVNEQTDSPEYELVLNKILCGVKAGIPIEREIVITAHEIEAAEGLLQGMITNWKQIGKTSLQGFRESFLQREGVLHRKGDDWELQVEAKGFDILLDYIPWSFSVVKLPWMQGVIHVKWRSGEGM